MKKLILIRKVVGKSMWPTIEPGSIVFASSLKRYQIGSVVIAHVGNRDVIKRVEAISVNGIWLAGDNRPISRDSRHFGPISASQVLGTKL